MRCRVFVVLWGMCSMGRGGGWIPAYAGMTWVVRDMTVGVGDLLGLRIFGKGVFQERD